MAAELISPLSTLEIDTRYNTAEPIIAWVETVRGHKVEEPEVADIKKALSLMKGLGVMNILFQVKFKQLHVSFAPQLGGTPHEGFNDDLATAMMTALHSHVASVCDNCGLTPDDVIRHLAQRQAMDPNFKREVR